MRYLRIADKHAPLKSGSDDRRQLASEARMAKRHCRRLETGATLSPVAVRRIQGGGSVGRPHFFEEKVL